MGNDDINIVFAACLAIVMLIITAIAEKRQEQKILKSEIPDVQEEKQNSSQISH